MRREALLLASVLTAAAVALCPGGAAHNAPAAPEQYIRFLSDCSDDWGGHSAVRDGHDLVALDMTERWLRDFGEPGFFVQLTVGFGFAETGSQGGPLREEVEVATPKGPVKVRLVTSDNLAFSGEAAQGFRVPDVVMPVRPSLLSNGKQDGSRILIEFGFRHSTLGLSIGDKVTSAKVQAFARDDRGDFMPGGYYLVGVSSGGERECPQSGHQGSGDPGTLYIRKDYAMRGTETPYVGVSLNTDAVAVSGNQTGYLTLTVANKFSKQTQTVTVNASGPADWTFGITYPEGQTAAAQASIPVELSIAAPSGRAQNATVALAIDTDVGGHAVRGVPLAWYPAGVIPPDASKPTGGSPSPSFMPICGLVAVVALWMRRRGSDA